YAGHSAENCPTASETQTSQIQNVAPTTSTDPVNNEYIPTASTALTTLTDQINNENIPTASTAPTTSTDHINKQNIQIASTAPTTSTDQINNEYIPRTQTVSSFTPTISTKPNIHILPATHATQSTDTQQISHDPSSNKRTIFEIISPPPNDTPENNSFPASKLKKPKSSITDTRSIQ
uniref:Integumentary mucin C.1-like n=1 Tax=Diabrotica virgifera virgifera TaxID=50390 RepID=A0A6P7GRA6_DIAVI